MYLSEFNKQVSLFKFPDQVDRSQPLINLTWLADSKAILRQVGYSEYTAVYDIIIRDFLYKFKTSEVTNIRYGDKLFKFSKPFKKYDDYFLKGQIEEIGNVYS